MEDWLKCLISPLVKYRQTQNKPNCRMRYRHNTTPCCASQHLFDVFTSERFIYKMLFYGNTQRVHIISIYFNKFLPLFSKLTHAFFIVGTSYALRRVGVLLKYSYEVFLYEFVILRRFSTKGTYLSQTIFVCIMAAVLRQRRRRAARNFRERRSAIPRSNWKVSTT